MDNAEALREVIERGFGAGDLDVVDRHAGPQIIEHEYAAPAASTGVATLRAMIDEARSGMPGLTMTVEDLVVDGDKVWTRSTGRASHPNGGPDVEITVFDICRFENGRIVEHWGVPDRFALLHQTGALTPPDSSRPLPTSRSYQNG